MAKMICTEIRALGSKFTAENPRYHGALRSIIVLAHIAFLSALSSPAFAQPFGLELVYAIGPYDSSDKTVTATCPAGKLVVSGGAETTSLQGNVFLDESLPDALLTSWTASAREDAVGSTDNWTLKTWVVCVDPSLHALLNIQRVQTTSARTLTATKIHSVSCPDGKQLTGVGGAVIGGAGNIVLDQVVPVPGLTVAQVHASREPSATVEQWELTGVAICGDFRGTNPVQLVTKQGIMWGSRPQRATAQCPSSSFMAFGGGGALVSRINGVYFAGGQGRVLLTDLRPNEYSFSASAEVGGSGAPFGWHVWAYVICWN
jgi:hypothetical protein